MSSYTHMVTESHTCSLLTQRALTLHPSLAIGHHSAHALGGSPLTWTGAVTFKADAARPASGD